MLAVNYSTVRSNFKTYLDQVNDKAEPIIVTRKNKKDAVLMSLEEYNKMIEEQKKLRNETYLKKLDESIQQIKEGKVVTKTLEELEEMISKM
ncbi:type II toxin-antitoxin system prevent-host-death family antitoxin [Methanimicrococcus sp. OttesenSCG-928-J09]|nr:type II toxin-antitoxin system prevent-host-death family antitoxin [Methanimicrococcus sp. OttesenSCG-928-J09]